jgi:hypothetical protein
VSPWAVAFPIHLSAATIQQENFINAVYQDLLNSPVDSNGLAFFSNMLDSGDTDFDVAYYIDTSPEYYTDLIDSDFQTYVTSPPDSAETTALLSEYTGGATDQQVLAGILGSGEYFSIRDGGDNTAFVNSIFQDLLGRPPTSMDIEFYLSLLNDGDTRSQVASLIIGSAEYIDQSEPALINGWFESYLNRPPTSMDLTFFEGILNDGETDEYAIAYILGSTEFFNLAQETPPASTPESNTFLPLALGLGFVMMNARRIQCALA